MADLAQRLSGLNPKIEKIMRIGGTAGLSLGILHHGKSVYHANFGYRDIESSLPVTEETIFPGCSLTKAITSAAIGLLVEEKKLSWNSLVKDLLPNFEIQGDILRNSTTITDLLSHRTGMSWGDNLYVGSNGNILIAGKDSMKYLNSQTPLLPFRGQFQYNNLGYEIVGHIIEALAGSSVPEFFSSRILKPVGLERTFYSKPPTGIKNVATSYNTLDDASPTPIESIKAGQDGFGGPSGGIFTCVQDLLKLYAVFLSSANDQFAKGTTFTDGSPLKQVNHLMSAQIPMPEPSLGEKSYGFGWARVQLPGPMGDIGCNPPLMPDGMPVVGKGAPSTLVWFHQGSFPGALAAAFLLPGTESAIVVLTNSLALNDTPDWVAQLVLEELLEVPDRNDYVAAAESSVAENAKWYPTTLKELQKEQTKGTSPRELEEYVGTYWDEYRIFKIEVTLEVDTLYWAFQGLDSEKFVLDHYEHDVFTWIRTRNELTKQGRWVDQGAAFWKAGFKANEDGKIDSLLWTHDVGVPAVEYRKI